jgi:uronate dehydrogenase
LGLPNELQAPAKEICCVTRRKRVVVTGAAGYVARILLPTFRQRYDLILLDSRTQDRDGRPVPGVEEADLTAEDRGQYRRHMAGAEAIVHLAWVRTPPGGDRFAHEMRNIRMAYNVYQSAVEEGVGRVVMASSNHAADYYQGLILAHKMDLVTPEMRPLSDNYYGWAKAAYEHLGFVFALGRESGRPLENVQIRIGGPSDDYVWRCPPGDLVTLRDRLATWVSARDLTQLFVRSIETEDIRDVRGVPFQIFYGISGNSHAFWSIVNARQVTGYAPQDNSEIYFRALIDKQLRIAAGKEGDASACAESS